MEELLENKLFPCGFQFLQVGKQAILFLNVKYKFWVIRLCVGCVAFALHTTNGNARAGARLFDMQNIRSMLFPKKGSWTFGCMLG